MATLVTTVPPRSTNAAPTRVSMASALKRKATTRVIVTMDIMDLLAQIQIQLEVRV